MNGKGYPSKKKNSWRLLNPQNPLHSRQEKARIMGLLYPLVR